MTIADFFKKAKARLRKEHVSDAPIVIRPVLPKKEGSLRLSKTVLPNSTKITSAADPFRAAAGSPTRGAGRGRETPVSLVGEVEVNTERSISLSLADVLEHLPQGAIKPAETFDASRNISLKAAEIEKGMATGQPTVSLASIYEVAPEIFLQSVASTDLTQVPLPFDKVLQQFQGAQVREDQFSEQAVPQLDTPFLKVTLEDTERFGTKLPQLQTSAKPPVKVEPATAKSIAKAEPEPVARKKPARRPLGVTPPASVPPAAGAGQSTAPARIPFHLPPNGTGVSASERVPASTGPPVPTSSPTSPPKPAAPTPAPPTPAAPARIPFKLAPPSPDLRPKFTLVPGVEPAEAAATAEAPAAEAAPETRKEGVTTVRLELNTVLRNVPIFQLKGPLPEIPPDVFIELPFALVEPQLASGRVAIVPQTFQAAIPEQYRDWFVVDSTETPVLLPLHEVLKNLPSTVLKMRPDQERVEAVDHFETPFSLEAKADERRFRESAGASGKPAEVETPKIAVEAETAKTESAAPETVAGGVDAGSAIHGKQDSPGSTLPATTADEAKPEAAEKTQPAEEKNDAKEVVARATSLPGVAACSIIFADGLNVAGNIPSEVAADGLCAMAPSLLQKIEKHMLDTKLGSLTAMTLHCTESPLTFFMEGNVCLTVLHADRQLESNTQEKLAEMVKELSRVYTQPETNHVDH